MTVIIMKAVPQGRVDIDESGVQKTCSERPEVYLAAGCLKHGSTMEGREQSFRFLTKSRQKSAVLVNERAHELWFPLAGKAAPDCIWVSYFHVLKVFGGKENHCDILFDNGYQENIPYNSRTVKLQIKRCRTFMEQIAEYDEKNQ